MKFNFTTTRLKLLDFDIENRPLSYLGMDFTTSEITAIAWKWSGTRDKPVVYVYDGSPDSTYMMLSHFVTAYNEADVVTGHYIRNHDLPIINGALIEYSFLPLQEKMTSCTKNDLIGFKGLSKSQENLSEMFGLRAPKVHMNTPRWREANRLTEQGIELTKERVVGDVKQHIELRAALVSRNLLAPPKMWRPKVSGRFAA